MLIPDPKTLEALLAADAHDSQWAAADLVQIIMAHRGDGVWQSYTADEYIATILANVPPLDNNSVP